MTDRNAMDPSFRAIDEIAQGLRDFSRVMAGGKDIPFDSRRKRRWQEMLDENHAEIYAAGRTYLFDILTLGLASRDRRFWDAHFHANIGPDGYTHTFTRVNYSSLSDLETRLGVCIDRVEFRLKDRARLSEKLAYAVITGQGGLYDQVGIRLIVSDASVVEKDTQPKSRRIAKPSTNVSSPSIETILAENNSDVGTFSGQPVSLHYQTFYSLLSNTPEVMVQYYLWPKKKSGNNLGPVQRGPKAFMRHLVADHRGKVIPISDISEFLSVPNLEWSQVVTYENDAGVECASVAAGSLVVEFIPRSSTCALDFLGHLGKLPFLIDDSDAGLVTCLSGAFVEGTRRAFDYSIQQADPIRSLGYVLDSTVTLVTHDYHHSGLDVFKKHARGLPVPHQRNLSAMRRMALYFQNDLGLLIHDITPDSGSFAGHEKISLYHEIMASYSTEESLALHYLLWPDKERKRSHNSGALRSGPSSFFQHLILSHKGSPVTLDSLPEPVRDQIPSDVEIIKYVNHSGIDCVAFGSGSLVVDVHPRTISKPVLDYAGLFGYIPFRIDESSDVFIKRRDHTYPYRPALPASVFSIWHDDIEQLDGWTIRRDLVAVGYDYGHPEIAVEPKEIRGKDFVRHPKPIGSGSEYSGAIHLLFVLPNTRCNGDLVAEMQFRTREDHVRVEFGDTETHHEKHVGRKYSITEDERRVFATDDNYRQALAAVRHLIGMRRRFQQQPRFSNGSSPQNKDESYELVFQILDAYSSVRRDYNTESNVARSLVSMINDLPMRVLDDTPAPDLTVCSSDGRIRPSSITNLSLHVYSSLKDLASPEEFPELSIPTDSRDWDRILGQHVFTEWFKYLIDFMKEDKTRKGKSHLDLSLTELGGYQFVREFSGVLRPHVYGEVRLDEEASLKALEDFYSVFPINPEEFNPSLYPRVRPVHLNSASTQTDIMQTDIIFPLGVWDQSIYFVPSSVTTRSQIRDFSSSREPLAYAYDFLYDRGLYPFMINFILENSVIACKELLTTLAYSTPANRGKVAGRVPKYDFVV